MKTSVETTVLENADDKEIGRLRVKLKVKLQVIKDLKAKTQEHFDSDPTTEELYLPEQRGLGRYLAFARRNIAHGTKAEYLCGEDEIRLHTSQGLLKAEMSERVMDRRYDLRVEAEGNEKFVDDFYKLLVQHA